MLDHLAIDVSDLERSAAFYEAALTPLGYRLQRRTNGHAAFGVAVGPSKSPDPAGDFWIVQGQPQPKAVHLAFSAISRQAVAAFHAAALTAGGRDNGAPGLRPQYHADYFAAFILDPDGYNIEAVCHRAE